jgi:uncharacterized protein YndB with AHSA1/START domain
MISEQKLAIDPATTLSGVVNVAVKVSAPSASVWQSLTDSNVVAQWFGDLSTDLKSGRGARLDFGDGDFFELEAIALLPPNLIEYDWRFLGIGPTDSITWRIEPTEGGCLVTVRDEQPGRTHEAAMSLQEGWLDFTSRLVAYHATGQNARYDWRRELDVGLPIKGPAKEVWISLFAPQAQTQWLPFNSPIESGAWATVADGAMPEMICFDQVTWQPAQRAEFQVLSDHWNKPTTCRIELTARNDDTLVYVSHNGWEHISDDRSEQLKQRKRFCDLWIESLKRAAMIGRPQPT